MTPSAQKGASGWSPATLRRQNKRSTRTHPSSFRNVQYREGVRVGSFLEVEAPPGYWWGYYDLNPIDQSPPHYDENGAWSGGAGYHARQ